MICNIAIYLLMTYTISTNFINGIFRPCRVYKSIQYLFTKTFSSSSYSLFSNIPPFFIITRSEAKLSSSQTHSTRTNAMSSPCFSICEA